MVNTLISQAWVARDKSGELWLYGDEKPRKRNLWSDDGAWASDGVLMVPLNSSLFPSVNWEDEEPTEVTITIQPKNK